MSREKTIPRVVNALKNRQFHVSTFFESNTCFDIIAKTHSVTLIIKVYENIDALRKEQGGELKKLALVTGAACIIIGEKTKVFSLEDNTVYYRYGVPSVTIGSFEKLLEQEVPETRYFKGRRIVDIDSGAMRKKREEMRLSLEELAEKIGVATETLYRFEHGSSTSLETANRIGKELDDDFIKKVDLLPRKRLHMEFDETPRQKLLGKVHDLGVKMALFEHAPFNAFGEEDRGLFIGTGRGKADIPRKAIELKKASAIINTDSIIVTKEYKYKSAEGIPVLEEDDLDTMSRAKDLKKLILEREEKK